MSVMLIDHTKTSVLLWFFTGRWFNSTEVLMEHIRVEGLPEPVARMVEAMVQVLREPLAKEQKQAPGELPVWPGAVIGSLTREDIYDDVT